ncbi:hypothetical protein HYV83_01910 [Candidatus Woesearchaeota archaeon]|nr:hypothetical protein [Candidatus Woesearchaeota archaeon]
MDTELEDLKKQRLEQIKQAYAGQYQRYATERQQAEAETAQQLEAIEEIVKAHLTKEALQRYGTLKLAHPETATQFIVAVAQAIEAGRLKSFLSEEQMVNALKQISKLSQQQQHGKIKVVRK